MKLKRNKIRLLYYSFTISIVFILVLLLSYNSFKTFSSLTAESVDELGSGIIDMKKIYVQDVIDRTIQNIDIERKRVEEVINNEIIYTRELLTKLFLNTTSLNEFYEHIDSEDLVHPETSLILYNINENTITHILNSTDDLEAQLLESDVMDSLSSSGMVDKLELNNYIIFQYISNIYIENRVKSTIIHRIRNERFVDEGYIWINHILDYGGGDNYAIRLVHPNIPDSEGFFLSTNIKDIQGNLPYLNELNGINKDGELFQEYYFKKMNTDSISRKLSYAKLYEPYDWILATGVYLDDVDELVKIKTENMKNANQSHLWTALIISFISLFISVSVIILFEKQINKIITDYENTVSEQTTELENEKKLIERIAYIDPLTGLLNRRAIFSELEVALSKAKRHGEIFSVVIGDLDFFKKVNDSYGHGAGDYVLKAISEIIISNCRKEDFVARWGGEEFLILLNRSNEEETYKKIDNIRYLIEQTDFTYDGITIKLTASFGFSTYTNDILNYTEVIKDADQQMYFSKRNGRNRVSFNNIS